MFSLEGHSVLDGFFVSGKVDLVAGSDEHLVESSWRRAQNFPSVPGCPPPHPGASSPSGLCRAHWARVGPLEPPVLLVCGRSLNCLSFGMNSGTERSCTTSVDLGTGRFTLVSSSRDASGPPCTQACCGDGHVSGALGA